jgi:hypothetical protein
MTLSASTVSEGTDVTVTAQFTDAGTDTHTCTVDFGDGHNASVTVTETVGIPTVGSCSVSHKYEDDSGVGMFTVSVTVTDDDGAADSETAAIKVNNVAPTVGSVRFNPVSPVNEGTPVMVSASFTDPGVADTHTCSVDFGDGHSSPGTVFEPVGVTAGRCTASRTYPDDSGALSLTVSVTVTDDEHAGDSETAALKVNNVAPTATLSNNGPISEGGSASISFTNQVDPSSADTAAGFQYAYSCDGSTIAVTTYAAASSNASTSCAFNDNGSKLVRGRIFDKDNGYTDYETTVVVNNVAPTATLSNAGPVNEGSSVTINFAGQFDPSSADTVAGFKYDYSCDGSAMVTTYAAAGSSASTSCAFGDNGTMIVRGRIFDKDNGYTEYETNVTVNNVVPTRTSSSLVFTNPYTGEAGASISFTDPGWLDKVRATFNWAGALVTTDWAPKGSAPGPVTGTLSSSYTFTAGGCVAAAISVHLTDDDYGNSPEYELAAANSVGKYTASFLAPIKDGARNIVKLGNVIPVKVEVLDCHGTPVLNRTLTVLLVNGITPDDTWNGDNLTEGTSVSSADTGNQMRIADGHYMYNLATKGLKTGAPFTIIIRDMALPAGSQNIATAAIELKK